MKYLLSMDGGGSKTMWMLTSESGEFVAAYKSSGVSHPQMGLETMLESIHQGIDELLKRGSCQKEDVLSAAFGVPCYGEYPLVDPIIYSDLQQYLSNSNVSVYNDVELGFAGSLCLADGIHLVAGTGAIAIGRNGKGVLARSNGWHPHFSDEGSGYWLGMQTLSLFTKQADGRVCRGALYSIVREELSLSADEDIITYYDTVLDRDRKKTAALQLLLKKAALAGDASAVALFEKAAYELYMSVAGLYEKLDFSAEDSVKISYSGGLFSPGSFLLEPFRKLAQNLDAEVVEPAFSPVQGGILLAAKQAGFSDIKRICRLLKDTVAEREE